MGVKFPAAPISAGICIAFILAGCAGAMREAPAGPGLASNSPSCASMDYTKISASAPEFPQWVPFPPGDKDRKHFMVGVSGYHATDVDARADAMQQARVEFARYTGVEVSKKKKTSTKTDGSSSSILDPIISGTCLLYTSPSPRD